MTPDHDKNEQVEHLLTTPHLADALQSTQFRRFLDQIPLAIVISEMKPEERIVYANPEFESLSGLAVADLVDKPWTALNGEDCTDAERTLGTACMTGDDSLGTFRIERQDRPPAVVNAYSNVIEDENGEPAFRLAALVDAPALDAEQLEKYEQRVREKDTLLKELQHRVRNNLQMITALIRIEARNVQGGTEADKFNRLAGRVESLKLLYDALAGDGQSDVVDLGIYLSQVVSAAMRAYAVEGIRLDLKVDTYPVSVNVAMSTGLVVNELLTNALKHAFIGRDHGTITLRSLMGPEGWCVIVADDGVGLPAGEEWPRNGKLSALIVNALRTNANARVQIDSTPGSGTSVKIVFTRAAAAGG